MAARRARSRVAAGVLGLALLAGCGLPLYMDMEDAIAFCTDRARDALGPRAEIDLATGTGGPRYGAAVSISTDFLFGRDPQRIYENCVVQRTGELPTRPLRF